MSDGNLESCSAAERREQLCERKEQPDTVLMNPANWLDLLQRLLHRDDHLSDLNFKVLALLSHLLVAAALLLCYLDRRDGRRHELLRAGRHPPRDGLPHPHRGHHRGRGPYWKP